MTKTLVIDNYDSFTYNLVHFLGELGAEITVRRNDKITLEEIAAMAPEAIVLSPGPCSPTEAGICLAVIDRFKGQIPMLGVCLGHQAIGEAFGGTVARAPELMHGMVSQVTHDGSALFHGIRSPFAAGRYHSLALVEADLPAELRVTARAENGTIMAVAHESLPILGVQFHPESVLTEDGHRLLGNWLRSVPGRA